MQLPSKLTYRQFYNKIYYNVLLDLIRNQQGLELSILGILRRLCFYARLIRPYIVFNILLYPRLLVSPLYQRQYALKAKVTCSRGVIVFLEHFQPYTLRYVYLTLIEYKALQAYLLVAQLALLILQQLLQRLLYLVYFSIACYVAQD